MKFRLTVAEAFTRQLGLAIITAEDEEHNSEPVGLACTMDEASELANADMNRRLRALEHDDDPGICPYEYILWARGISGWYERIAVALVTEPAALPESTASSEQKGANR